MSEAWPFLLFFPAFVGIWCAVCFAIAASGGWRSLAETYPAAATLFTGTRWRMRTGSMGWARYRSALTLGADMRGLYLAVFFLFRPGHAPLYIPWDDVVITVRRGFLTNYADFTFRRRPKVRLTVSEKLGVAIAREANRPVIRP